MRKAAAGLLFWVLLPLLLLEATARLYDSYVHKPFVRISTPDGVVYQTNPRNWGFREDLRFLQPKPDGNFRIFVFGGSTTEGGIYPGYKVSFPVFLGELLKEYGSGNPEYEIINFARSGEASKHVMTKCKIAAELSPDLFIVYSGHNEYLDLVDPYSPHLSGGWAFLNTVKLVELGLRWYFSLFPQRLVQRIGQSRQLIDHPVAPPSELQKKIYDYEKNLDMIAKLCKRKKIPLLLIGPAGNYAGWQPNRSFLSVRLSKRQLKEWERLYSKASINFAAGQFLKAKELIDSCLAIDSTFAEALYLRGKIALRMGQYSDAKSAFLAAIRHDGAPIIASSEILHAMARVAHRYGFPFIDANEILEKELSAPTESQEFFLDAHHPNWEGDLLIARAILQRLCEMQWLPDADRIQDNLKRKGLRPFEIMQRLHITKTDSAYFFLGRANWFLKAASMRWDPQERLRQAHEYLQRAAAIDSLDGLVDLSFALWYCKQGMGNIARRYLESAMRAGQSKKVKVTLKSPWVRSIFYHCPELEFTLKD